MSHTPIPPTQYVFGEFREGELSEADVREVLAQARNRVETLRSVPVADILDLLDRLSRRWSDPADPFRRAALDGLPAQIGFSRQMVARDLEGFCLALSRAYCEAKIRRELGGEACLDGWVRTDLLGRAATSDRSPFVRALSRGVVLHVSAGNVGSVGVLSLVEGLLAKNVSILKASSAAPLFPRLFAESLLETDEDGIVARSLAILSWSGRKSRHHKIFQQQADAIVVWGGEDAVKEYRDGLGIQAQLIEWGPKISCGLVSREADLAEAARHAARDVSMWDQAACSSAQVIYVEAARKEAAPREEAAREGAAAKQDQEREDRLGAFVSALESELAAFAAELPMGDLGLQERAEITKNRELAMIDVALGRAELHVPGGDSPESTQQWTIVVEADPAFKLSPLFRTVYVKPVDDLEDCAAHLAPYAAYLQTVGLAAPADRLLRLANRLCGAGVLRVTPLGSMGGGHPGEPHDGSFALQRLVKWVSLDSPALAGRFDAADFLDAGSVAEFQWNLLRAAYRRVRALSPFYARRFPRDHLRGMADWLDLPPLSKAEYRAHVPPEGRDLLCGSDADALTLRSGGTSGVPQVALVSRADFEADMQAGARGAFAAGLRPGDRVANVFFAGNLYGSFLSTNRIVEILGCRNYPLSSFASVEDVLEVLRTFQIDTLIGIPATLQLIFRAMREAPERYRVRKVYYAGEHFYKKEQAYWKEALGLSRIASIGYGTVDAGPIAFQCPASEGSVHHVLVGHQFVEILDRDTLRPVAPGEIGEVVVSNLAPRLMPLIRYRIGDLGRMVVGPCPCGREAPRLELLGRADDVAVVGGYNLAYASFLQVVERYPGLLSSPQLELQQPGHRDRLVVKVEHGGESGAAGAAEVPDEAIAAELREAFLAEVPEIQKAISSGMLEEIEVRVLPSGGLERLDRTGKIVHVIDRRRRTGQLV